MRKEKKEICKINDFPEDCNEIFVWNGSKTTNPDIIYLDKFYGFDACYSRTGNALGPGIYMATNA